MLLCIVLCKIANNIYQTNNPEVLNLIIKIKQYLQNNLNYNTFEIEKIIYGLQAILSELSKLLIALIISFYFGCMDKVIVATIVLLSIRSNSGGLHFLHYISCFAFTMAFYASVIIISCFPLSNTCVALGLQISLGIFAYIGPITSCMRPKLKPYEIKKYSNRVIFLLLIYSILLISVETLPYRETIYWAIVLQIFQLFCAKVARKGGTDEKKSYTNCG